MNQHQPLTASVTSTDTAREIRCMLAWLNGDKAALDLVLEEVMADPVGVPGLLFSLLGLVTQLGTRLYPDDFMEHLQANLAYRMLDPDADDIESDDAVEDGEGSEPW